MKYTLVQVMAMLAYWFAFGIAAPIHGAVPSVAYYHDNHAFGPIPRASSFGGVTSRAVPIALRRGGYNAQGEAGVELGRGGYNVAEGEVVESSRRDVPIDFDRGGDNAEHGEDSGPSSRAIITNSGRGGHNVEQVLEVEVEQVRL